MKELPYKHNLIDGIPVPIFVTPERMLEIKEKHVSRPDDVYIATYQKSGTTWLQYILNLLYDEPQGPKDNINLAVPWLEECAQDSVSAHDYVSAMRSPRIFKTHDLWEWVPKSEGVRYIYCYRNPKDVVCSYFNHMANVFKGHYGYTGAFDEFFTDIFTSPGRAEQGFHLDHIAGWLRNSDNPNILFIRYEDMVEDLQREVSKIVGFLGLQCPENKLDQIVGDSSFQSMRSNPKVNYEWRNGEKKDPKGKFMSKGKVGSWKVQLSKEQSDLLDLLWSTHIEQPFGIKMRDTL